MSNYDKCRSINQDNWKRTQLRIPIELYESVVKFGKENNLSLNSSFLTLCEKALNQSNDSQSTQNIDLSKAIAEIKAEIQSLKEKPTA